MYKNLTRFMGSDLPVARRSIARVMIITEHVLLSFLQKKCGAPLETMFRRPCNILLLNCGQLYKGAIIR